MILGWTPSIPRYLGGKFESVPKRCKSGKASSSGKVGTNLRLIRSNQILTGAKASLGNFTAIWWGGGGGGIFVFHKLLQVRLLPGGQLSLQLITGWQLYQPYSHHIQCISYTMLMVYSVYTVHTNSITISYRRPHWFSTKLSPILVIPLNFRQFWWLFYRKF